MAVTLDHPASGKFNFAFLDAVKWESFVTQFLTSDSTPGLFVVDLKAEEFYDDVNVQSAQELDAFLVQVVEGKVPSKPQGGGSVLKTLSKNPIALLGVVVAVVLLLVAVIPRNPGPRTHEE